MPIIVEPTTSAASTVDLCAVWLNAAADPGDFVSFPAPASLSTTQGVNGQVRNLANGRTRVVRRAGASRTYSLSLPELTRAEIAWLEDHVGQVVCVRDHVGRKIYATYFAIPVTEGRYVTDHGDADISLTEVTFSEAV